MIHQAVFGAIASSRKIVETVGSAAGVVYTPSQTSTYGAETVGTYANLTDGNGTTGAGTDGGTNRIFATFPSPVLVANVKVGGGTLGSGFGAVALYLNNSVLQYSTDNAAWVDVLTISGVTDSGVNQFKTFTLPTPITAQYWRLSRSTFAATTEFVFT